MNLDTKTLMKKFSIRPTKSLGQNFLTDEGVLKKIAGAAELTKNDIVLEVGPGLGSLTAQLAENAGAVLAVEIDRHLIPALRESLGSYPNIHIIHGDIMRIDPENELRPYIKDGEGTDRQLKVVANLPYYITTPVIMKLLESGLKAKTMVFMVQKEVADRMRAKPGGKDYGALSVAVQYYSKPSIVLDVPPHSFIPQPDVDSSVIRLDIYDKAPVELRDKELFFRLVKASFGQRRKTLVNALNNAGLFSRGKDEIKMVLSEIGIEENRRGETLSIEQFAQLSNIIHDRQHEPDKRADD
ncbi:MAG TPA: 16S rRNA (adenine(1518)-N(6)/adenine(1519)-N(6))-dimethyltransferase RsmA [Clostridia bacterium]|nr:16S rRNA (adenine(1518)-N(6)/adenine(1519)-N(6))-dimethyltransferase RsmA [Clostridia bacterium]